MSLNHILQIFHCFPNMNNFHLKIDLTKQHFHHTAAAFYMVYYKLICLNRLFCPQTRSINPCHLWFRHPWSARNLLKRPSYKVTKLWAVLSMSWEEVVIGNWSRIIGNTDSNQDQQMIGGDCTNRTKSYAFIKFFYVLSYSYINRWFAYDFCCLCLTLCNIIAHM